MLLRELLRHMRGPIIVLLDKSSTHKVAPLEQLLGQHRRLHIGYRSARLCLRVANESLLEEAASPLHCRPGSRCAATLAHFSYATAQSCMNRRREWIYPPSLPICELSQALHRWRAVLGRRVWNCTPLDRESSFFRRPDRADTNRGSRCR